MILDFNPTSRAFFLKVPRDGSSLVNDLRVDHGLDFSITASTPETAVLLTHEPYAAVAFFDYGTERAKHELRNMHEQINLSWAKESKGHLDMPSDEQLAPFQIAGVEYAKGRQNTLLADVPGLGKTPMAIVYANEIRAKRVLVLCPANIRLQWAQMIRRWSTMEWPYDVYPILHGRHGVHPTAAWNIVSYDLAHTESIWKALAKGHYDLIIIDEAHYLKTIDTKRTRAVFGGGEAPVAPWLASRADAILGLSGTPLPNRPREAYTLARGMCWDAIDFMSEDKFNFRFNPSLQVEAPNGGMYVDERSGRHGELQARLRSNFMVRRAKYGADGVGYQLGMTNMPDFDLVQITPDNAIKAALKAESMLDIDPENLEGADAVALGHISVVRRQMGMAMAPHVADYVRMLLDGGEEKIVLFGHHIAVLDTLQERLNNYGVVRIDGRLNATQKQARVDQFIRDPKKQVCLGNMQSMGTGTDGLQHVAHHAVFAEADWVPGVNQQAVDRLDRGGQKWQVLAEFLVAPNSFSERVLAAALRKNIITNKALDKRQPGRLILPGDPAFLEDQ